ncbi:MAG: AAA family ATPase, partial [Myxococcota bacterium]
MLAYLRIRGLALLDDVTLDLASGMTVLTGETGAGKSIIVGALSLLRGGRARADMVRAGVASAVIDARFDPGPQAWQRIAALTEELGITLGDIEDGLIVRRTIAKNGRSRCFLQDAPTTQAALARVGELLVDICSQHEHHFLTHAPHHLEVLDAYAGCEAMLAEYRAAYGGWRSALAELTELQARTQDRAQRTDYLRFQIEELETVSPEPGEHEALTRKYTLLKDVQRWAEFAAEAQHHLYEGDHAVAGTLATLASRASDGVAQSAALAEVCEHLTAAQVSCEDAARAAARLGDELDVEPGELEAVSERLHALQSLRRKHGVAAEQLAERLTQMRAELSELEHAEARLSEADARQAECKAHCVGLAERLHERRAAAAEGLCAAVVTELAALHLDGARLEVRV